MKQNRFKNSNNYTKNYDELAQRNRIKNEQNLMRNKMRNAVRNSVKKSVKRRVKTGCGDWFLLMILIAFSLIFWALVFF